MSVNKVMILGTLGRDPEVKKLNDNAVCNLSVATSERWKDKQGVNQEKTEWHKVAFWGSGICEVIAKYFRKGSQIWIEGSLQTEKWQDKDGNDRYTTKIKGHNFSFVDKKGAGAGGSTGGGDFKDGGIGGFGDIEEDIPF